MIIHVLPGDAPVEEFAKTRLKGEMVICREAFIDGDVRAVDLDELWNVREKFWAADRIEGAGDYRSSVVAELDKLRNVPAGAEVNLWFEYELFCHVNMWFCVWLLRETAAEMFRVAPSVVTENEIWNGFGKLNADDLKRCFSQRVKFAAADIALGTELWTAYQHRDYAKLRELSQIESRCYPFLREACEAEIEKDFRPKQVIEELQRQGFDDFGEVFAAFREKAGVYGYGDAQVRRILADG
jgi:hypothetical protein